MHDGYIYTLGVCGSSTGGPAPTCLDLMLTAIPPVKRAAYLGEVLLSTGEPSLEDDPLLSPVREELADVEVLLVVTTLPGGRLPGRIMALARAIEEAPRLTGRRFAALVTFSDGSLAGLWPLRHALETAGVEILEEIYLAADAEAPDFTDEVTTLARRVYSRARAMRPEARP